MGETLSKQNQNGPTVCPYDFRHPARVNRDQLRGLQNLHETFARLLSSTFSRAMRDVVEVETAFVDQTTYAEFMLSLSNPSCSYQFVLQPTNGQAVLDFPVPLAFAFVDRACGGSGTSKSPETRPLTPIEIQLVNKIAKRAFDDLEAIWQPLVGAKMTDIELEINPEFLQTAEAAEIVILLAFEVRRAGFKELVSLCYPFFTLEAILPRLSGAFDRDAADAIMARRRAEREEIRRRLGAVPLDILGTVPVDLCVELGTRRPQMDLARARRLAPGDVIRLEAGPDDPCVVYVGDRPKYRARPYADEGGRLYVELEGPCRD